jgi:hypothetical protein
LLQVSPNFYSIVEVQWLPKCRTSLVLEWSKRVGTGQLNYRLIRTGCFRMLLKKTDLYTKKNFHCETMIYSNHLKYGQSSFRSQMVHLAGTGHPYTGPLKTGQICPLFRWSTSLYHFRHEIVLKHFSFCIEQYS